MKEKHEIIRELIGSIILSTAYLRKDSVDIKRKVQEKNAETNCLRILLMTPVFLLLNICNILTANKLHPNSAPVNISHPIIDLLHLTPKASLALNLFMMAVIFVYGALIVRLLFFNKEKTEQEKASGCKLIYRSFWGLWMLGIVCTSLEQILLGRNMLFYIVVCIIICMVPLYSTVEFFSILLICMFLAGCLLQTGPNNNIRIFIYSYIAMFIIGFIAQRFEVEMWTLQEYVYLNTYIDPLTGLLNRRGGNALLSSELRKTKGSSPMLGVIMLDIDYFKKYNDTLGHDAGDACLQAVSACIKQAVKDRTQITIRHGGEEFVVILIDSTKEETIHWAEKIRKTVFDKGMPAPYKKAADVVTVSVGSSITAADNGDRYEKFLELADQALYRAKNSGRNQVVFFEQQHLQDPANCDAQLTESNYPTS